MLFKGVFARYIVTEPEEHGLTHEPLKPDWRHAIRVEPGSYEVTGEYDHADGIISEFSGRIHVSGQVIECSDGEHLGQVWDRSRLVSPACIARLTIEGDTSHFQLAPDFMAVATGDPYDPTYQIRLRSRETLAEIDAALRKLVLPREG